MSKAVIIIRILSIYALLHVSLANAASPPDTNKSIHVGVSGCAGSTCHGASEPDKDSPVKQDEFMVWHQKDKHAKAYKILFKKESKRIAKNLGLESAHTANMCLDCHADNVPEAQRGRRFQISDGVTCEVCHGSGAQGWFGLHITGTVSHAENVAAGLYPLEDPQKRAKVCLSCHLGDKSHKMTHKIMGAGHPRLSFELDTFTMVQPAHFVIDKDYRKRKKVWSSAETWAIGQIQAASLVLNNMKDSGLLGKGLFPELIYFDCHSCHHDYKQNRWEARKTTSLEPGAIRINDSSILMLRHIARAIDSKLADNIDQSLLIMHQSSMQSMELTLIAINDLLSQVQTLKKRVRNQPLSSKNFNTILNSILEEASTGEFRDYVAAEQFAMAVDSIISTQVERGEFNSEKIIMLKANMDKIYVQLKKEDKYKPAEFIVAVKSLSANLEN